MHSKYKWMKTLDRFVASKKSFGFIDQVFVSSLSPFSLCFPIFINFSFSCFISFITETCWIIIFKSDRKVGIVWITQTIAKEHLLCQNFTCLTILFNCINFALEKKFHSLWITNLNYFSWKEEHKHFFEHQNFRGLEIRQPENRMLNPRLIPILISTVKGNIMLMSIWFQNMLQYIIFQSLISIDYILEGGSKNIEEEIL